MFRGRLRCPAAQYSGPAGRQAVTVDIEKIFGLAAHRAPGIQDAERLYAVLIALNRDERTGEYSVLYEVRSDTIDAQPGEVCFPGGHIEPGEGALECALRETQEELGIPPELIEVCCELDTFHPSCNIVIRPFLARLLPGAAGAITPSPDEVKDFFFVPLSELSEPYYSRTYPAVRVLPKDFPYEMIGIDERYGWRSITEELVVYRYKERVIWGFTALMTRALMRFLSSLSGEGGAT